MRSHSGSGSALILPVLLLAGARVSATCYRLDGLPYSKIRSDDGDWIPCDTNSRVSSCCSSKDYCMGNGLCLDAGANNYFSIQGCTDPSWPSPCISSPQCVSNIRTVLRLPPSHPPFDLTLTCIADCCTNSSNFLAFQGVTSISRPTLLPPGASSNPSNLSPTTVTVTVTATPGTGQSVVASPAPADDKTLGIGLGVGLAMGLALIGAIIFFGCQVRRRNKQQDYAPVTPVTSPTIPPPPPGNQGDNKPMAMVMPMPSPQEQQQQQQQQTQIGMGIGSYYYEPQQQHQQHQQQYPSNNTPPVQQPPYNYSPQAPALAATLYQMQQQQHNQQQIPGGPGGGGHPVVMHQPGQGQLHEFQG
ncbi:hypothetical protein QBC46DRAFT_357496 [Diplogelasinospora grovesii]|uniref:Mid2 domain-containing protein n=1 Tax=Diplogelasinospora grovesii TaxID=303347 RepID=A0AAN6N0C2_9PEZI|nr:hypothetical protein QBC46DRAFT_357496 [Diplogelasinospora grovesii]